MSAPDRPRCVVIAGRDVALWLAAATLGRALRPAGVTVAAVELPTRLTAADTIATLPPIEALHARIGIDEDRLLRATGGAFSFGHNFVSSAGGAFFHAWGSYGAAIDGQPFLGHWLRARAAGLEAAFQDFCLAAVAAKNGRMLVPDEETRAFGRADYGYLLPALAYAGYLKAAAQAAGVALHRARALEGAREPGGGGVAALLADGDRRIEGDLFVDASGEDALLIGATASPVESWRALFPVDRLLVAAAPPLASIPPYAEVRASAAGWTVLRPTAVTTGVAHAFSSDLIDDAAALQAARVAAGIAFVDAVFRPVTPGFREPWSGNCIALGAAAAALDPMHAADLHLVQLGLVQLLALFPAQRGAVAERIEYNRAMRLHAERIRDFQAAWYVVSRERGPFWERARAAVVPPSLAHRLGTFAARGTIAPMEDDSFAADEWQALLLGQGIVPESRPPTADATPPERLKSELRRLLGFIAAKVKAQPSHDDYLRRFARSRAA